MEARITKISYSLKSVLDQEVDLLQELLSVMLQENKLLLDSGTSQLFELNKTKELLILQHSYIDRTRRDHTSNLARALKLENSEPKLTVLIEMLEGKLSDALLQLQMKLKQLVEDIQQLSSENSKLIECSINAVQDSWGMLKRQFVNPENCKKLNRFEKNQKSSTLIQGRI